MLPETVTISEGAARWGVGHSTLRRAIKRGDLQVYRPGRRVLIDIVSGDLWWKESGSRVRGAVKSPSRRRRVW